MGVVRELKVDSIHIPWELFPRVVTGMVEEKVKEYADMIESGVEFDPILVWDKGNGEYWVVDGVHRLEAHKRAGRSTIKAELISCKDEIDCQIKAIQANLKHGLSIKKEEKISLVQKFYYHRGISVEELSKIFGVSERTIYRWVESVMKQKKEDLKEQFLKLRAQGLTQEAIAKMLGVGQATISRWERKSLEKIEENQKDKLEKH
jgi:transposase